MERDGGGLEGRAASKKKSYSETSLASRDLIKFDPWDASAVSRGRELVGYTLERNGAVLAVDADHHLIAAFTKQKDATAAVLTGRVNAA